MQGFSMYTKCVRIGLGVLMFCLLSVGQGLGVEYTFEVLEFPGATRTNPFGINDAGDVVGIATFVPGPFTGGFSFLLDGTTFVYTVIRGPSMNEAENWYRRQLTIKQCVVREKYRGIVVRALDHGIGSIHSIPVGNGKTAHS